MYVEIDGKRRKITTRKDGYQLFTHNGKTTYYHIYLAEKFIPKVKGCNVVNHKDGNKSNNSLSNLEWSTKRNNCEHARLNGLSSVKLQGIENLTQDQVKDIRNKKNGGYTFKELAKEYQRDYRTIWDICNFKRYKDY